MVGGPIRFVCFRTSAICDVGGRATRQAAPQQLEGESRRVRIACMTRARLSMRTRILDTRPETHSRHDMAADRRKFTSQEATVVAGSHQNWPASAVELQARHKGNCECGVAERVKRRHLPQLVRFLC